MVSVIIPTYNEEKVLPHTLRELLRQCGDYEVIVADGGSTDRTRAVLKLGLLLPEWVISA